MHPCPTVADGFNRRLSQRHEVGNELIRSSAESRGDFGVRRDNVLLLSLSFIDNPATRNGCQQSYRAIFIDHPGLRFDLSSPKCNS